MSDAVAQAHPAPTIEGQGGLANNETRTLRRRRSHASAALLTRPSMLTLGELDPCFETCVLVYATSDIGKAGTIQCGEKEPSRLIYALFEPNYLVDGASRSVRKLDRASWERLRSHVEELRIVAHSFRYGDEPLSEPNSPISAASGSLRKPDCVFDLSMPTDEPSHHTVSQIYLQPESYTSIPARSRDELLEIEIHAPSDAALAEHRRVCLPTQVRAVLHDAEQLMTATMPTLTPPNVEESQLGGQDEVDFAAVCTRILRLVQSPLSTS